MTAAVTEAVRERLERVKSKGMKERIMKIAKEFALHAERNNFDRPIMANFCMTRRGLPK